MAVDYKFEYKCRLCGKVFYPCLTGSKALAHSTIIDLISRNPVYHQGVYKETFHLCNDGDMGVADLQGVKEIEV